jgi:hypothetical protein
MRLPSHALPPCVALAVLSLDLRSRAGFRRLHVVLALALLAIGSVVVVQHQWIRPYGLPTSMSGQRHEVAGLPGVTVDLGTKAFLEDVAASMASAGFRPGDPIVALDYMPGLVFYLGGTSPGFAFYMFDRPRFNCFFIDHAGLASPPYLILGRPMSLEQQACIRSFDFPDQFRRVRALRNPYESVYAGFGAPGFSHVLLYAPDGAPQGR